VTRPPDTDSLAPLLAPAVRRVLRASLVVSLVLVLAPTAYMVVWAFWGSDVAGVLSGPAPTLHWFQSLFSDAEWLRTLGYSLLVALAAAGTALVVTFLQAYLGRFAPPWADTITYCITGLVVLFPAVPYAMSVRHVGDALALGEFFPLLLGHVALAVPLQFVLMDAARETIPIEALWSGRIMGASHRTNLRRVFLPYVQPLLFTCFAVAFFFSFDDVVVAGFVITSPDVTVPVRLWNDHAQVVRPDAAVIGTCLLAITSVVAVLQTRRREDMHRIFEWLSHQARHFVYDFFVALGGFLLAFPFVHAKEATWAGRAGEFTLCGLFGLALALIVRLYHVRRPVGTLLGLRSSAVPRVRTAGWQFLFDAVDRLSENVRMLEGGSAVAMSLQDVKDYSRECFAVCEGRYVGTDRHVPSRFLELYPEYLQQQVAERSAERFDDVRFLLIGDAELRADIASHEARCHDFLRVHTARSYTLLMAPWSVAVQLAQEQGLPSPDIGVFGGAFVVFFEPPDVSNGQFTLTVRSFDDRASKQMVREYLSGLVDHARKLLAENSVVRIEDITEEDRRQLRKAVTESVEG